MACRMRVARRRAGGRGRGKEQGRQGTENLASLPSQLAHAAERCPFLPHQALQPSTLLRYIAELRSGRPRCAFRWWLETGIYCMECKVRVDTLDLQGFGFLDHMELSSCFRMKPIHILLLCL